MTNKVISFIHKRFPKDCEWTTGNCYHFVVILNSVFSGEIYYDVIRGHFMFLWNEDNNFYDWNGIVTDYGCLIRWNDFGNYDILQKERVIKDCIL